MLISLGPPPFSGKKGFESAYKYNFEILDSCQGYNLNNLNLSERKQCKLETLPTDT